MNTTHQQFTKVEVPQEWQPFWGKESWRDEKFAKEVQKGGSMNNRLTIEQRFKFKNGELSGSFSVI